MQEIGKALNYVYPSTMSEPPFSTPQGVEWRVLICEKSGVKSVHMVVGRMKILTWADHNGIPESKNAL